MNHQIVSKWFIQLFIKHKLLIIHTIYMLIMLFRHLISLPFIIRSGGYMELVKNKYFV